MKLTDDEVIALGVRAGTPWPGPTPTVDLAQEGALAAATGRGERSLYVRGLIADDADDSQGALDPQVSELLEPALRRRVVCSVFMADTAMRWYPAGLNVVYYAGDGGGVCLVESVSAGGVHEFGEVARDVAVGSVTEMAQAAWEGGVRLAADAEPTETLCIATVENELPRVLQVSRSSAMLRVDADPGHPVARDELDSLLGALT